LPEPQSFTSDYDTIKVEIEDVKAMVDTLNDQQRKAFELIIEKIDTTGGLFILMVQQDQWDEVTCSLTETSVSRLDINSKEAGRIRDSSLILIDEVSMMSKHALNAIDEVLRRIHYSDDIFGGKTVLLGGDFRQTANIVIKGTPRDIIENSIMSSRLWEK
ncbi:hypothetical protein TNCT_17901, partial [Trichonephila clavata]